MTTPPSLQIELQDAADQMMLFAHTGIALGIAWLPHQALRARQVSEKRVAPTSAAGRMKSRLALFAAEPDYRLVLLGSMLPDIIDKPLGTWLLVDTLSNGRIYAHTLLLSLVLAALGIYLGLARRGSGWLWLAIGSMVHLALDQMWRSPGTLFWPLYGLKFPAVDTNGWVERVFLNMLREPSVYVPEIIGALVLLAFFVNLVRRGRLFGFLRTGEAA